MERVDLDWKNLGFGYLKTKCNVRYTYKNGKWDDGIVTSDEMLPLHMAATCLHYGQEAFEGLKAFEHKNGAVGVFRIEENAKRMDRTARKIFMEPVPEKIFIEGVFRAINENRCYIPPYGTGASLYVRPLLIGSGPQVGVKPAEEYMFVVFVTPVGPYFKTGFKPVDLIVEDEYDRAAPNGVGDIKVGGNYAAGMRASIRAKSKGYTEVLYLDAKEKKYIDESGPANFFAITKDGKYITPESHSILPSVTNMSLFTLAGEMGLNQERRQVEITEIFDFAEAGCCGTAAVITPVGSITWGDKKVVYCEDGNAGPKCTELYKRLTAIQLGDAADPYGWVRIVPKP